MMKTVSFHNASIGRAKRELLKLDGLKIEPGLNLIVAPNGYGKTSLLLTLAGVLAPISGRITGNESAHYVSEYLTFPKFVYPLEWIRYSARKNPPASELDIWVKKFRLESQMSRYMGRLSQGERRKVTWLSAHFSDSELLLLDEPLDGLDFFGIEAAREMLRDWKARGKNVCIVAHQLGELLDLADQVLLIRDLGLHSRKVAPDALRQTLIDFYSGH